MTSADDELFGDGDQVNVRGVTLVRGEDAARRREKLARIILDELYEFVGLLDADGNTLEINRAALDGAGVRLDQIAGRPFWDARWWAVSNESRQESHDMVQRAGEGSFVRCDVEVYGRASGDETIIVDYSLTPIRDENGRVVFLLPEGRNITDKKAAEAELARRTEEQERLLERIQRLDNVKSTFFANVSHELRTPLTLILGPLDALLDDRSNLTDQQVGNLELVRRNATSLLRQVNALLDLAKADAGEMQLTYARVDLAERIRMTAAYFDGLAAQRSIRYLVECPETLPAEVDVDKFERVVLNLLSNAFKFTPDHGRIRCRLARSRAGMVLLTVRDSGPGVAPEYRADIFDRFHQAAADGLQGGTGLGLAIARDSVELHGGTITVTDAPGGGALFQVEIPDRAPAGRYVRDEPASVASYEATFVEGVLDQSDRPVESVGPSRADAPVVVVAEDHPDMRRFITETLRADTRVLATADGAQALRAARESPPDLIVTDLMMPNASGEELVAELRRDPVLARVPVLVLSARADDELRHRLLADSVQDYLVKPFSAHELRARVRNLVTAHRAREALQRELATQNDDLAALTDALIAARRDLQRSHDEYQRTQAELARAQSELARVTRATALGELAASIAHEVNQPLAAVMANADASMRWLAATPSNHEEAIAAMQRVAREAGRAGEIIAGIRRFLNRREQTEHETLDIAEVVDDVVALVAGYADDRRAAITHERSDEVPRVTANRTQLQQVLVNLVLNALEATSNVPQPRVSISTHGEPLGGVRITVADNGCGIDDGAASGVFEPFFTTKPDGLGMGLAITRSIVEAHGGSVRVASTGSSGTTIEVVFPDREETT